MSAIPQGGSDYAAQIAIGAPGGDLVHGQATIGVTAVLVRAANAKVRSRIFFNNGPGTLSAGGASVTTGNSIPLIPQTTLVLDRSNGDIYFISSSAGTDLRFMEEQNA